MFGKDGKKKVSHDLLTIQFTFLFPKLYLVEFFSFFFLDNILFLVSLPPKYEITLYICFQKPKGENPLDEIML
jgi:hypothetical protein